MSKRKKHGIFIVINGVLLATAGAVIFATDATPVLLPIILQSVGVLFGLLGFAFVYPDIPK